MKTFNHRMTGLHLRRILAADAQRRRGWHRVVELCALVAVLLTMVLLFALMGG